jgi:hypothetical protein
MKSAKVNPLTGEHNLAMGGFPLDGRWQTEAQLVGRTQLGSRTGRICRDLAKAGFCERKVVPILCDWSDAKVFMRMYKVTWEMRQAYWKRSKLSLLECLPT